MVATLSGVSTGLAEARELFELARDEDDEDTMAAVEADLDAAEKLVADLEFRRMFNNPAAPNNCIIDIQAGAGGTFEATAREPGLQLNRHFGKWTFVQP